MRTRIPRATQSAKDAPDLTVRSATNRPNYTIANILDDLGGSYAGPLVVSSDSEFL